MPPAALHTMDTDNTQCSCKKRCQTCKYSANLWLLKSWLLL